MKTPVASLLLLILAPVIAAIWSLRWFVTQDGPAHLYAATILRDRLAGGASYGPFFAVNALVPNISGHALLALLTTFLPPRVADQFLMTTLTAGLAVAMLWLYRTVRPEEEAAPLLPLFALVPLNRLWLLGFYNFLLGALLLALTLAVWWRGRERLSWRRTGSLAGLVLLTWFSHPIAFGATAFALTVLALATGGRTVARGARTFAAFVPVVPFAIAYARMVGHHGEIAPTLRAARSSLGGYLQTMFRVKFLALSPSETLPFVPARFPLFILGAPSLLVAIAVVLVVIAIARRGVTASLAGWRIAAVFLFALALLGPDSLGSEHGEFLRERLFLLAVIASVPLWSVPPRKKTFVILVAAALLGQTLFVWEYAIRSHRVVGELLSVETAIRPGASVCPITIRPQVRMRATPERHAANLLGTRDGRVVWRSYESELYYFPVTYREPLQPCVDAAAVPQFAIAVAESKRIDEVRWELCTLWANRTRIDTVVTFGESDLSSALPPEYRFVAGSRERRAKVYARSPNVQPPMAVSGFPVRLSRERRRT